VRGGQILGPDSVGYTENVESNGAINDIRLGVSYSVRQNFSIGFGLHGYTGENRMSLRRQYDDSLAYGTLTRELTINYLGNAFSAGATWRLHPQIAIAASLRTGGGLDVSVGDTIIAEGRAPNRFGAGIRFDGLPGASVALSIERTQWSSLDEMLQTSLTARDAWEIGGGIELSGPKLRNVPVLFYLGYRQRDLPFSLDNAEVTERFISAGTGIPVMGPRVLLDMAVQRASRGELQGVSENAWIFSMGFTVRP
jgi:long-subunit fatty acid transport protein